MVEIEVQVLGPWQFSRLGVEETLIWVTKDGHREYVAKKREIRAREAFYERLREYLDG